MCYEIKQDSDTRKNLLSLNRLTIFTLVTALGMSSTVAAGEAMEEDVDVLQQQDSAMEGDGSDARVLLDMARGAGITMTPEAIERMLAVHPEVLDAAYSAEPALAEPRAAAIFPARFQVTDQATIYVDTDLNRKFAGGRFTSTGIDVLLNYSSVLGGISYENMAFSGSSHNNEIEAKLAVDAEFEAFGVYGRADVGPPPFPTYVYGVYGTTNQPGGYGVYARNNAPEEGGAALFATGEITGSLTTGGTDHIDNHVAIVENTSSANTHVLALSMPNDTALGFADNFVTFYHGGGTPSDAVGTIQGNVGGVSYVSGSADFAEWIPRQNPDEIISAGDIVGVAGGKVSRNLSKVEYVQVVSTAPAFAGNDPGLGKHDQYALVAMMGQVPVKVIGAVTAGDYIVASGHDDGTGVAVPQERMTPEDYRLAVGRAWESSAEQAVKLIRTAVGLGANDAYAYMRKQDQHIARLERQLSSKMAQLDRLATQMETLTEKVAYIQSASLVAKALGK